MTSLGSHGEELAERLNGMFSWLCEGADCKDPERRGDKPNPPLCPSCEALKELELCRTASRAEIFRPTRVPHLHRFYPPWMPELKEGEPEPEDSAGDGWPKDPRAAGICPCLDWPKMAARLAGDRAARGPRSVVFAGSNSVGKSYRAAELVFRLHRAGLFFATWIHEAELVEELGLAAWQVRPMMHAARETPVLVLDDVFSHRGGPASVESAAGLVLDLVERRWSNPAKITIYTTHRALTAKAAKERGLDDGDSVQRLAPPVLERWRDGLLLDLGHAKGHRGEWAK